MKLLIIDNSKEASIYRKDSHWENPGAKFYNTLLDSFYYADSDNDNVQELVNDPRNLSPQDFLKEAYLIAPVDKIKNSPYGVTPYSRSGCKYPHHEIRGDKLVVNINGLKAAYARARQMKVFKGGVKEHLMRHIKELGLEEEFNVHNDELIEENFNWIEAYLYTSESIEGDIRYMIESKENNGYHGDYLTEEITVSEDKTETEQPAPKAESLPKQTDAKEKGANGVKRKELYIEFIKYAKTIHSNNLFGSVFDKNAFDLYNFVPHEMQYFYRLANPLLCVLKDSLTFFALSELKKINVENKDIDKLLVFAADKSNKLIIFNKQDKKIYEGESKEKKVICNIELSGSFDTYLESLIGTKILGESYIIDTDNGE